MPTLFTLGPVLLFGGCYLNSSDTANSIEDLELVQAYTVTADQAVEPSGLVMVQGTLYTVADKVDDTIYRLEFAQDDVVHLVPHIIFTPPNPSYMDWEGLTCDAEGNFYLISERQGRVLRVTPTGEAAWATPDLRVEGRQLGLFSKRNAGFEGITLIDENHFIGAVEWEPRGLVEWKGRGDEMEITAFLANESPHKAALPLLRFPDYSGLDVDNGQLFALFRGAHLVVRLEKGPDGWSEGEAWSFRHIETDPRWAYASQTYGKAEGLVVRGQDVYLIFDNNLEPRQRNPRDRSPLFVHARFPGKD